MAERSARSRIASQQRRRCSSLVSDDENVGDRLRADRDELGGVLLREAEIDDDEQDGAQEDALVTVVPSPRPPSARRLGEVVAE